MDLNLAVAAAHDPTSVMRYISEFFGVRADLGRAGVPSDIAPVVCFLASERNTYTTGAKLERGRRLGVLRLTARQL